MTLPDYGDLERIVAESRQTLAALHASVLAADAVITEIGAVAGRGNAEVDAGADRDQALRRFAAAYEPVGDQLEPVVGAFERDMATLDTQVGQILDFIYRDPAVAAIAGDHLRSLVAVGGQTREAFVKLATLPNSMELMGRAIPILGPATARVARDLRRLARAAEPIYGWADRAEALLGQT